MAERVAYPGKLNCLRCAGATPRHCSNPRCSWYDCKRRSCRSDTDGEGTRTYVSGTPDTDPISGKRTWWCFNQPLIPEPVPKDPLPKPPSSS